MNPDGPGRSSKRDVTNNRMEQRARPRASRGGYDIAVRTYEPDITGVGSHAPLNSQQLIRIKIDV